METTGPPILPTKRAACQPAILCTQARMPVLAPAAADLQAHREDLLDVLRAQRLEGMHYPVVEICCGGYYDALQACEGGSTRIELNAALSLGGVTPTLGTLKLVKRDTCLKVVCMRSPALGRQIWASSLRLSNSTEEDRLRETSWGAATGWQFPRF